MNLTELLQDIQDAYAEKLQMTVIITNALGKSITSLSHLTSITEYTLSSIRRKDQESRLDQREWLRKLQHPVLMDTQHISPYMGMKIIVAPIQMEDGNHYYIWAGNLIEKGYKTLVLQGFEQNGENGWEKVAQDLTESSILEIDEKIQMVKNMSIVIEELVAGQQKKKNITSIMEVMTNSIEGNYSSIERYQQYIKAILHLDKDIDFIVFAKKHGTHHYKVVRADGKLQKLSSLTFTIERTFVEECIEKKQYGTRHHMNPMNRFFIHDFPISPKSLFCYPLIVEEQVVGIVFGGSETKHSTFSNLEQYGKILISMMTACVQTDFVKESLDHHLMKMASLLDMSRVLEMATKKEELLSMLVDFALQFIAGDFCMVTLKNEKSFHKITNKKIQSEELIAFHIQNAKSRFDSLPVSERQPKLGESKWGTILDYPIYYRQEVLGAITIHLQNLSDIKEAEVYMASLTSRGAAALKQLEMKSKQEDDGVSSIHLEKSSILEILTSRELDVLQFLVKGCSNREIAEELFISVHTVKNHITKIFQKLNVSDRSQLIAMVYQLNFMKSS